MSSPPHDPDNHSRGPTRSNHLQAMAVSCCAIMRGDHRKRVRGAVESVDPQVPFRVVVLFFRLRDFRLGCFADVVDAGCDDDPGKEVFFVCDSPRGERFP
mmetsp:Transcript_8757/g.13281  ORF Transcript_8757/g.13281 Transcript_8757/m.13281 type:complete len:100 (+) Transcript_8757:999-1298(+)